MKRIAAMACAMLLTAGVAGVWAADIEGKIQSMDTSDRAIVLDNGTKLFLAEGVNMEGLKEGAQVKASYEERDGKNVVTDISVSQ